MNKKTKVTRGLAPYVFLLLFIIGCLFMYSSFNTKVNKFSYDEFISNLNNGQISEITITPKTRTEVYEITGKLKNYAKNESFTLNLPKSDEIIVRILEGKDKETFSINVKTDPEASSWIAIATNVLPMILLIGATIFF